jgi:hypothetical protein
MALYISDLISFLFFFPSLLLHRDGRSEDQEALPAGATIEGTYRGRKS